MPRFISLHILAISLLSFSCVFGSDFVSQAFSNCTQAFYDCGMGNITKACTAAFGNCLDDEVFVNAPLYPEACDLSSAAIENLGWTLGTCGMVVVGSLVLPICLKVCAWGINKCLDAPEGTWKHKIGKGLATITKGNVAASADDAEMNSAQRVTATDLVNPQVVVAVICASVPITSGVTANKQAALCESAKAAARAAFPQYYGSIGSFLTTKAFSDCATTFYGCGALQNITDVCISGFGTCLDEDVFAADPAYPEDCYVRDAMWQNVWWVFGISVAAISSTVIIPATLKLCAAGINSCVKAKEGTWKKWLGNVLLVMFDTNQDGVVTAKELIDPQLIVGIYSVLYALSVGTDYNTQDAYCTSAMRVLRASATR